MNPTNGIYFINSYLAIALKIFFSLFRFLFILFFFLTLEVFIKVYLVEFSCFFGGWGAGRLSLIFSIKRAWIPKDLILVPTVPPNHVSLEFVT